MKFITDTILINWNITTVCNYRCSYCPSYLHDGLYKFPKNTTNILKFLSDVQQKYEHKKIYLIILGGEPTLWPKFDKFLQLVPNNVYIEIMSNGSRPIQWWKDINLDRIHQLILTYHSEHANKDKFVELCEFLAKNFKNFFHVSIMAPPNDTEWVEVFNALKNIKNLSVGAKAIRIDFGDSYFNYTDQEFKFIESCRAWHNTNKKNIFTFDNKGFYKLSFKKKNTWIGQFCHIGVDSFCIEHDDEIHRGTCKVGGSIGSLDSYILPETGIICTKKWCPCSSDGVIKKEKIT
jgi:organic radical activating enzyme